MARKVKENNTVKEDPVESKYKTKIKYYCPKRGWVTQEVEVTKYKPQAIPEQPRYTIADELSLEEFVDEFENSTDTVD